VDLDVFLCFSSWCLALAKVVVLFYSSFSSFGRGFLVIRFWVVSTDSGAAVVVVSAHFRSCLVCLWCFSSCFRVVAAHASSPVVVVVEELDLVSLWWFGRRFWGSISLYLCCSVLGFYGLLLGDSLLVILMRGFWWDFHCSSDDFGSGPLFRRWFQWLLVALARLLVGMEMAEPVVGVIVWWWWWRWCCGGDEVEVVWWR
jgi:hypothetical protein